MRAVFKSLEVNENDTLGDAVIKGMTDGFIKGTVVSGVGLGAVVLLIKTISKKGNSKKKEEVKQEITDEELEQAFEEENDLSNEVK